MLDNTNHDQQRSVKRLADYFAAKRAEYIAAYRGAFMAYQRRNARATALHYGRLLRKMRGAV